MRWRPLALLFAVFLATFGNASAATPITTLDVDEGLLTAGELAAWQRDADLAQRTGVPTAFVLMRREAESVGAAQDYADAYRLEHAVETVSGADDGIVFLIYWIPDSPDQSTVVYSAGSNAFTTSGLSDTAITAYIERDVLPRLQSGQLFEAGTFLMRMTRATGLYVPPPARTITGATRIVRNALTIIAPVIVLGAMVAMCMLRAPSNRQRMVVILVGLAVTFVLASLSVWTHSTVGIVSCLAMLLMLLVWGLWVTRETTARPFKWSQVAPDAIIALVMIAISLTINWQQVEQTPGDRDETRWINRAYYAADLDDPFGPTWQDYTITVGQPPLGSMAIGIGMALQGQDLRATGVWDYQYDKNWYTATGGYPTQQAMTAARRTNAVIGALATGTAYVLGRLMTNRVGGIAAGLYLAWQPLHIVLSSQALSDETFVLLLLLSLVAAWRFADRPTWGRAILLGVFLGLGGATKLTPLLLAPPLLGFGVLRLLIDKSEAGRRAGWMLVAQPLIAFGSFVAIYPWLWENPIERTWRLFAFRSSEMDAQTSAWPKALTDSPLDALSRFGYKLTYTHSTSRKALQHVYDWLGIHRDAVGVDLVLAAAGVVILLWSIGRHGLWTPRALVSILMAGEITLLTLGMKADFYRYHLPVVVIVSALIAVAIGTAWTSVVAMFRKQSLVTKPSFAAEEAIA